MTDVQTNDASRLLDEEVKTKFLQMAEERNFEKEKLGSQDEIDRLDVRFAERGVTLDLQALTSYVEINDWEGALLRLAHAREGMALLSDTLNALTIRDLGRDGAIDLATEMLVQRMLHDAAPSDGGAA